MTASPSRTSSNYTSTNTSTNATPTGTANERAWRRYTQGNSLDAFKRLEEEKVFFVEFSVESSIEFSLLKLKL